jgi:oligoendopeptidase F
MAELLERSKIEDKFKWRLSDIIDGTEKWEELFKKVSSKSGDCLKFKGRLKDRKALLECFKIEEELSKDISALYVYAKMKSDEDTAISQYKGMVDRAEMLAVTIESNNSFVVPEITQIDKEELLNISKSPEFADFSVELTEIVM